MVKKTEGIILYVKIDKVRDEEDSLGYIRSHFQEYVNDFENCIDSAVTSKYVSNSNLSILKNCDYELQEALSCLNTLKIHFNWRAMNMKKVIKQRCQHIIWEIYMRIPRFIKQQHLKLL